MKCVLLVVLLAIGVYSVIAAEEGDSKIDVDEVFSNDRLYQRYFLCLKGEGVCTPEGKELKDNLGDMLKTSCGNCTPKQKQNVEKAVKYVYDKKPDDYAVLEVIYDPDKIYRAKYEKH